MRRMLQIGLGVAAVVLVGSGCDMHPPKEEKPKAPQKTETVGDAAAEEAEAPRYFPSGG